MICPNCERYKASASMWRNKAYEASGHPLPWKPDELWVGLTDEEIEACHDEIRTRLMNTYSNKDIYRVLEAKLKEKNT